MNPHREGKLRVLDLFSGIGGFSLGLERTGGFETVAFCEIEPYPRAVLKKHWPKVPQYEDVRTLTADTLARDGIAVDVICGGFPCQDISFAGAGAGLAGERSGLWREYSRLIGELRPRFVIVENVSALLSQGIGTVLGDMAALGYDAEWHCIPASAVGAPHRRDRIWIIAYTGGQQHEGDSALIGRALAAQLHAADTPVVFGDGGEFYGEHSERKVSEPGNRRRTDGNVADTIGIRWREMEPPIFRRAKSKGTADQTANSGFTGGWAWWSTEPDVGRVADGVPRRVDRLKGLGNAVVPQIPELIGRAILEAERASQ